MAGWDPLHQLLREEMQQRAEEGCDTAPLRAQVEAALETKHPAQLNAAYDALMALPIRSDFAFVEPSDLAGIRAERPPGPRQCADTNTAAQWSAKFLGAWQGRCVGCALGKPLEHGPYMAGAHGQPGWRNIERWFAGADAWPIRGYTPANSRAAAEYGLDLSPWSMRSVRERIAFMESDDDIRYSVLGLALLEEKGSTFDTWDIGKHWHARLTYGQMCTAETQAYLNFARVTSHTDGARPANMAEQLDWVRTHRNPYREWIGAQIRADPYGYVMAGRPEQAAAFAWRDAALSHVKNGIYGAMFVAAMTAAAFVEADSEQIVAIGLSEIPAQSRLAHDIAHAVAIARAATSQLELVDRIWEAFKHYHPVHTNNNAALVAAALIFAKDDFTTAITTAVLGGWDTDCNGATVGSIMGAKLGAQAIPATWTAPLHDALYAEVTGFQPIAISACAERTEAVFHKLRSEHNGPQTGSASMPA